MSEESATTEESAPTVQAEEGRTFGENIDRIKRAAELTREEMPILARLLDESIEMADLLQSKPRKNEGEEKQRIRSLFGSAVHLADTIIKNAELEEMMKAVLTEDDDELPEAPRVDSDDDNGESEVPD